MMRVDDDNNKMVATTNRKKNMLTCTYNAAARIVTFLLADCTPATRAFSSHIIPSKQTKNASDGTPMRKSMRSFSNTMILRLDSGS